ncbi:nitrate regulatory gene2 protein isoform X3 [Dendrobium catenatum]|uniref:nitrate regulatory gene2 protein isoform X3 n=1 Tax=Dendrobium catenatum TaxID=906689 RepID=UPI0009F21EEE|nr:nitrate regulatory gene2 protein isoform X3 [Dendrobium catenatum]
MGCVHSRVEKEETVWRCRERKRFMKQLLSCRSELAAAHMAYLQSLRNTGATLRQFTEAESEFFGNSPPRVALPPSPPPPPPPPPLPPSPPPPPQQNTCKKVMVVDERSSNDDDDDSSIGIDTDDDDNGVVEEEKWAETITEFEDEEGEKKFEGSGADVALILAKDKSPSRELTDDSSSTVSRITKETDAAVVLWRSKKTLTGIVKEIDDYFLKAAAGGSDLLVLLESSHGHNLESNFKNTKGRTSKSAKVLSWNWSLKTPHSNRGACGQSYCESCKAGKHRTTLQKIYAEEEKLYKEVKEDELVKIQLKKMISLLDKLETTENDYTKSEKLRLDVETLQTQILSLQESINATCLSISKLRDEELYPQLVELTFGFLRMWRIMYECHQVQNHISQQANLLDNHPGTEPTTDSHRFATVQLENEVASWHASFCHLLKSLRSYAHVLNQWVRLTDCLPCCTNAPKSIKGIHSLCEEWQMALGQLPDKVAADSIKSLVSVIHSIVLQQNVELSQQKKSKRLENRLEKELNSINPALSTDPDNQPSSNNTKLEALKKRVEEEKAKYLSSICVSRAMTLNNLHASLPNVFQALMGFSIVCLQALDGIVQSAEAPTES